MQFEEGRKLSELTTFGVGGPARYFATVSTIEELQSVLKHCHQNQIPFFPLGKGSNTLFDDRGFRGLVILSKIVHCDIGVGGGVSVGSGFSFSLLGSQTARKGFAGLEFASGIPGSVGGAIYMNAGANGGETFQMLTEVTFVDDRGEVHVFPKSELTASYRTSSFQSMKGMIASAKFQLSFQAEARQRQLKIIQYRTETQPYGDMSAGCVFRNPPGGSAGALIEKCGLKGAKIGDAEVSTLHANFIVNKRQAKADDVLKLAAHVQKHVQEQTGVHLEMEVKVIPYDF